MYEELEKAVKSNKISELQYRVYLALLTIPVGKVTTYKSLAQNVGCKSARAIGQILRRNPYAPKVPCHRVVRSDSSVGGFSGSLGCAYVKKKYQLLKSEGVTFRSEVDVKTKNVLVKKTPSGNALANLQVNNQHLYNLPSHETSFVRH